jgi:Acetoacetate decarboxylase (ADC)
MPLFGLRETDAFIEHAAEMPDLETEALTIPRVEVLQIMEEIDDQWMQRLLPPALHPTIPPTVTFLFWKCAESEIGPFQLAQVRIGCRAGARPRGFPLASWCDSEQAAQALRSRWGFNCRPGRVRLTRYYDRITGSVLAGDRPVLQVSIVDPQPISGADVAYTPNMNLAHVPRNGSLLPRLVQVDPDYAIHRADRGRPSVDRFEREPATGGVIPVYPVSGSYTVCDISLPRLRYISDPERPTMEGTEKLHGAT